MFYFNCKARLGGEICSSGINMHRGFCFVRLFNFLMLPMDYLYGEFLNKSVVCVYCVSLLGRQFTS